MACICPSLPESYPYFSESHCACLCPISSYKNTSQIELRSSHMTSRNCLLKDPCFNYSHFLIYWGIRLQHMNRWGRHDLSHSICLTMIINVLYLFKCIYFWLHWVFIPAWAGVTLQLWCMDFSLQCFPRYSVWALEHVEQALSFP